MHGKITIIKHLCCGFQRALLHVFYKAEVPAAVCALVMPHKALLIQKNRCAWVNIGDHIKHISHVLADCFCNKYIGTWLIFLILHLLSEWLVAALAFHSLI